MKRANPSIDRELPPNASLERPASKKAKKRRRFKPRVLSTVEALPVEIIQQIFFFTVNPNFPRSSPVIAYKLSNQRIYELQCRRLFACFKGPNPCPPDYTSMRQATVEDEAQLAKAQSETLKCKWMNFDLFDRIGQELLEEEKRLRIDRGIINAKDDKTTGEEDPLPFERYADLELWLGPNCHIPARLFRWPMDDAQRKFLDVLTMAGCEVNWLNSLDGELATDMWIQAVVSRDYRLVHRLMSVGIMVRPAPEEVQGALKAVNWDAPMVKLMETTVAFVNDRALNEPLKWFKEVYPSTYIAIKANHPPGSPARTMLMATDCQAATLKWKGAPCRSKFTCYDGDEHLAEKGQQPPYIRVGKLGKWYTAQEAEYHGLDCGWA